MTATRPPMSLPLDIEAILASNEKDYIARQLHYMGRGYHAWKSEDSTVSGVSNALPWFRAAALLGHEEAMQQYAHFMLEKEQFDQAAFWFQRYLLKRQEHFFTGNVDDIIAALQKIALQNNPRALQALYNWYADKNNHEAYVFYSQTAKKLHAGQSMFKLAVAYRDGKGVSKNKELAADWFSRVVKTTCEWDTKASKAVLALYTAYPNHPAMICALMRVYSYEYKLGLAKELETKVRALNTPAALFELGHCLLLGEGCERNIEEAMRYLLNESLGEKYARRIELFDVFHAEKSDPAILYLLGRLYEVGCTVDKNIETAKNYIQKAISLDTKTELPDDAYLITMIFKNDVQAVQKILSKNTIPEARLNFILLEYVIRENESKKLYKMKEALETAGAVCTQDAVTTALLSAVLLRSDLIAIAGFLHAGANVDFVHQGKSILTWAASTPAIYAIFSNKMSAGHSVAGTELIPYPVASTTTPAQESLEAESKIVLADEILFENENQELLDKKLEFVIDFDPKWKSWHVSCVTDLEEFDADYLYRDRLLARIARVLFQINGLDALQWAEAAGVINWFALARSSRLCNQLIRWADNHNNATAMYCLGMARGSSNWHGRASKLGHTDSLLYLIKKYSGSSSKNNSLLISDFQKWLTASPHEQSVVLSVVKQLEEKNIWQSHTYVVDYFFGIDEPVIAYSYLEKSWEMSKKTDFLAQFKMGVCYFEGVGVERDLIKAIELMWEAIRDKTLDMPLQQEFNKILPRIESSQEEAFKYNILGRCYLFGQGLPVNWQLAIDYTEKANELDDKKTYSYSPGQKFIHAVIHQDEDVVKRYLAGKINKKFFSDILLEVIIKRKTLNKLHKMAELLEEAGALITQETLNSELIKAARLFNVDMMIGLCQAGADLEYQEAGKTAVAYLPLSLQASFQSRLKAEMPDLKVSMEQAYAELSISDASDILNLVRIYDLSKIKNKVFLSDLLCKVISEGASSLALEFIKKLKDDRAVDVFCTVSSEGLLPLHCVVNVQNINQATLNFKLLSELLSVAPFLQLYQKDRQRKSPADYAKKFEPLKRVIQQYEGRADFFDYQYYMAARKTSDKWGLGMRMQAYDEIFGLFLQKKFPECQKAIKKNIEAIDVPLVPSKNVDILKGILQQNLQILYDAYMMYSVGVVFNIKKPSAHVANGLFANSNQHGADASCQHLRGLVM